MFINSTKESAEYYFSQGQIGREKSLNISNWSSHGEVERIKVSQKHDAWFCLFEDRKTAVTADSKLSRSIHRQTACKEAVVVKKERFYFCAYISHILEAAAISKYSSLWREPRQIKFAETDKGPRIVAKSSLKGGQTESRQELMKHSTGEKLFPV